MAEQPASSKKVFLTGASGFVGGYVFRELIARGYHPVCLLRSGDRFRRAATNVDPAMYSVIEGTLFQPAALARATRDAMAAIHLVGIIVERRGLGRGQSFRRVHVEGTRQVVDAARAAGVPRFIHMSALGSRPDAPATYHRTKYEAEQIVRASGMAWTIFRPSIIHGPDGEFMELVKSFVASPFPPVIPYFGNGEHKLQPVSVRDVATCFVSALSNEATIGKVFEMGGPRAYTWKELYETCRRLIPGSCRIKPKVGVPVPVAKVIGRIGDLNDLLLGTRLGVPFNLDQVRMSQEDSTCDPRPVEQTFGIRLRDFEEELAAYANLIR